MKKIIYFFIIFLFGILYQNLNAEIFNPVKWSFSSKKIKDGEYELYVTAKIEPKWHIYSTNMVLKPEEVGPIKTEINFDKNPNYELVGKIQERAKIKKEFDKNFDLTLEMIENQVIYVQKIKLKSGLSKVSGKYTFGTCDDKQCLPPTYDEEFSVELKDGKSFSLQKSENKEINNDGVNSEKILPEKVDTGKLNQAFTTVDTNKLSNESKTEKTVPLETSKTQDSWWTLFIKGLAGGIIGLLSPCVYSMIPLTVSFFTKGSGSKRKGIINAFVYGASIIIIYVALGVITALLFGGEALNNMASNVYLNIFFFLIFVVFAVSFLGAFEIQLPTKWVNSSDKMSDKGGFLGIFFMAFTLALVSFSCTAPIIGNALAIISSGNGIMGPIFGMLGFGVALALPFTLFAIFPTWLNSMPKSGGWLNSIKVALGIIELAIAIKFLSAVDLAYHWDFLKREYFLAIWIILFTLLGMNLLGFIRFSHDSELKYVSIPRFLFATTSLAFALYMVPGLWGAPVNLLSGLAPPAHHNEGIWTPNLPVVANSGNTQNLEIKKYGDLFKPVHGLDIYFDYNQALAQARKTNKPLLIDFTGHSCVNCRKMESLVWSKPEVLKRLSQDFILVSLYVDDKTKLSEDEHYISKNRGKKITSIGDKWTDLEVTKFESNSQPLYVILNHKEELISGPVGFDPDENLFLQFLEKGVNQFKMKP